MRERLSCGENSVGKSSETRWMCWRRKKASKAESWGTPQKEVGGQGLDQKEPPVHC